MFISQMVKVVSIIVIILFIFIRHNNILCIIHKRHPIVIFSLFRINNLTLRHLTIQITIIPVSIQLTIIMIVYRLKRLQDIATLSQNRRII